MSMACTSKRLHHRPEYDDQRFVTKVTNATRWGAAAGGDHDELARFTYTFDAAGNRLSNAGHRGTGGNAEGFHKIQNIDAYQHDGLHRLTKVDYNMSATTGDEIYVYDSLGNRVTYTDQRNATTRTYANNVANEYASVATFAVTHDAAGNLSKQTVNGDGDAYVYAYDCDNRLLGVTFDEAGVGATPLATFAYDALGRKITAWTQYDVTGGGGDSQTADLRFYHDGQVELADYHSDGTLARRFVNGTQYIDERVALIEGEAGEADTFYYLLQELFTVTGLVEKNGALAEADVYDGYGKVRLWDYSPGDFDRDGDVDATDQTTFTTAMGLGAPGTPTPDPSTDLDMDGDTDLTDAGLFNTIKNAGGAVAERFASSLGNPFFFTGRRLYMLETLPEADATPVANQQLQHNRARHYSPLEGRWLQRDPLQYVDGAHLYEYARSKPVGTTDPSGKAALPPTNSPGLWCNNASANCGQFISGRGHLTATLSPAGGDYSPTSSDAVIHWVPNRAAWRSATCPCKAVRLVQIVREVQTRTLIWDVDFCGVDGPEWWGPNPGYDDDYNDDGGLAGNGGPCKGNKCRICDTPGINYDFKLRYFRQEFETCAVCVDHKSKECGAVFACVTWGHSYVWDPTGFMKTGLVAWTRWLGGESDSGSTNPRRGKTLGEGQEFTNGPSTTFVQRMCNFHWLPPSTLD
ncbi:MAG: hypothetical protein FLDDKLPJ_03305 [Phycisphaerae bacterium]|nr:hypothetical protein [Phycisphaerae bacterium]